MWAIAVLLAATAGACEVPPPEADRQLRLPYEAFDGHAGERSWRSLLGAGCTDAAVALLAGYAQANGDRLSPAQRRELQFHIGQALALAGREEEAIPYFSRAASEDAPGEWRAYVGATLAFLRHEPERLAAARRDYARLAPGSMRLRIIDGMIACAREPYAKAVHCRM